MLTSASEILSIGFTAPFANICLQISISSLNAAKVPATLVCSVSPPIGYIYNYVIKNITCINVYKYICIHIYAYLYTHIHINNEKNVYI
jgi:hypothetical protein